MGNKIYEYVLKITDRATATLNKVSGTAGKVENRMNSLMRTARQLSVALGLAFGASQMVAYGQDAVQTTAQIESLENAIRFTAGSAQLGEANLKFLDNTINDLKLDIMAAKQGFSDFSGSAMGSGITNGELQKTFYNVSTAARVMGLDVERQGRVFNALGKMLSTGVVQSDELKGMLAEALPGALKLSADAMGVTQKKLVEMVEDRAVDALPFVIKLGEQMAKVYGAGLPKAVDSLQAKLTELSNAQVLLKQSFVKELTPEILWLVSVMKDQFIPAIRVGFGYLRTAVTWVEQNAKGVKALAVGVTAAAVAYATLNGIVYISTIRIAAFTLAEAAAYIATYKFAGAMQLLNAVMAANPIGLVLTVIAALAAAFAYAWQKSETFRASIYALAAVVKNYFEGLYKFWHGLLTLDFNEMKSAFHQLGVGAADAWKTGWAEGVASFNLTDAVANMQGKQYGSKDFGVNSWQKLGGKSLTDTTGKPDNKTKADLGKISEGKRQTIVNVTIQNMTGIKELHTATFKEGVLKAEDMTLEMLIRALNGAVASVQ